MEIPSLRVIDSGPLATLQDLGRPGLLSMGVVASGAADRKSFTLANRLVGNDEADTGIEATFGGLGIEALTDLTVAVTGAPCEVRRNQTPTGHNCVIHLTSGDVLRFGAPTTGLRTYLAIRGGLIAPKVLGSNATDILSGLGPQPLQPGTVLNRGTPGHRLPSTDLAPVTPIPSDTVTLRVYPGPRDDLFDKQSIERLYSASWRAGNDCNRVGMRLLGPTLKRNSTDELLSEGVATGSLQVPAAGQPILFLSDHPVTGGYPVIGVVHSDDIDRAAQVRPGQNIRFVQAPSGILDTPLPGGGTGTRSRTTA